MPSIDIHFLNLLEENYKLYNIFIETGTYKGETVNSLETHFDLLYTIEINKKFYNDAKLKYKGNKINFLLGDSSVVFERLLPTINHNSIFFLDGHWSGGSTGKGKKDCPLIEEITCINNKFNKEAIIIIDDVRLFGLHPGNGCNEDWSGISKEAITNILSKRIKNVYYKPSIYNADDRLIISINSI
jgi:hypothetical protein